MIHSYLLRVITLSLLLTGYSISLSAQTVSIGGLVDEQIEIGVLLNKIDPHYSFSRPYSIESYNKVLENRSTSEKWWERSLAGSEIYNNRNFIVGLHPIWIQNTLNTRFPKSENNSAAWYGRGNTTELMGGFYVKGDYFTLNFQPHIAYQQNKDFLHPRFTTRNQAGDLRYIHVPLGVRFDVPFRFGPDPYSTFDLGYSSIRMHYSKFEIGLSNEPLWWGPANRYPLVMSNNAPGFPHFLLNTIEPLSIPYFGSLQITWIMGYPRESDYFDGQESGQVRFTNGINVSYSPAFYENLSFGFTRLYHLFELDGFNFNNVFRIFDPFSRSALVRRQGEDDIRQDRNQLASVYFNLHLPEANARIYAEFYREDHSFDMRDFLMQPHHNSAYSIGLQKISAAPFFDFIKMTLEFTSLTASQLQQVRPQVFFYGHSDIRQGHTNRGKILGAAIGPGSNSQFFSVEGFLSDYKFGLFLQRVTDNDNFHFREGSASLAPARFFGDFFRHRVDLNLGFEFLYGPGPFYLNSKLVWTKAYNYGRFDLGRYEGVSIINFDKFDRTNIQFQIGITYML